MKDFYCVRAFVDGEPQTKVVQGSNADEALQNFAEVKDEDKTQFSEHPIEVAMVHKITFGFYDQIYKDVTYSINSSWRRASYTQCLSFMLSEG